MVGKYVRISSSIRHPMLTKRSSILSRFPSTATIRVVVHTRESSTIRKKFAKEYASVQALPPLPVGESQVFGEHLISQLLDLALMSSDSDNQIAVTLTIKESDVSQLVQAARQRVHNAPAILDKLGKVRVLLDAIDALGDGLSLVRCFTHLCCIRGFISKHRFIRQPK